MKIIRKTKKRVPLPSTPGEPIQGRVPSTTHEESLEVIEYGRGQENLCSGTSVVMCRKRKTADIFYNDDEAESFGEEDRKWSRHDSDVKADKAESSHIAPVWEFSFAQTPGRSMKRKRDEEPADDTSQGSSQDGSPPLKKPVGQAWGFFNNFTWGTCPLVTKKDSMKMDKSEEATSTEDVTTPTERKAAPLGPGSFIFHYVIDEGWFGKVVLATHCDSGRLVAVKIVSKRSVITEDPNAIFAERKVLEMVGDIPFCINAHATFQTEDHLFYVMENLSGGNLSNLMLSKGPFDLDTIRFLAAELLCGLKSLHSKGVIHRDLKPENILLDGAGHVKICDFGLSVTDMFGDKTTRGQAGTCAYMAPEMVRNLKYDTSADYFSLGVLLYELAFDCHPFSPFRYDNRETMSGIRNRKPRFPSDADPVFMDFLNKLFNKNQRKRKEAIANIREHPFFQGINWEELEAGKTRPPCVLQENSEIDTSTTVDLDELLEYDQLGLLSQEDQKRFNGFSFVSQTW